MSREECDTLDHFFQCICTKYIYFSWCNSCVSSRRIGILDGSITNTSSGIPKTTWGFVYENGQETYPVSPHVWNGTTPVDWIFRYRRFPIRFPEINWLGRRISLSLNKLKCSHLEYRRGQVFIRARYRSCTCGLDIQISTFSNQISRNQLTGEEDFTLFEQA